MLARISTCSFEAVLFGYPYNLPLQNSSRYFIKLNKVYTTRVNSQQKSSEKLSDGFSQRLRSRMARLGIQANEVAEKVGVEASAVSNWTSGSNEAKGKNLRKLADVLGCSPQWLLTGMDSPLMLKEAEGPSYGGELDEPALHIGLNLIFDKIDAHDISRLIKEVNTHQRLSHAGKTFWIHVLSDWLQIKLATRIPPRKNPRGVSSKVAARAESGHGAAAAAAGVPLKSPPSAKPASPSDNEPEPTDPTDQGSDRGSAPPTQAPK